MFNVFFKKTLGAELNMQKIKITLFLTKYKHNFFQIMLLYIK